MSNQIITTVADATPTEKGVSTSNGGSGGEDKIVVLNTPQTITPEDKTIYIIKSSDIIFQMPQIARLGFRFKCIGLVGKCRMKLYPGSNQKFKYKEGETTIDLLPDHDWDDISMFCYEENTKFKWLTYVIG